MDAPPPRTPTRTPSVHLRATIASAPDTDAPVWADAASRVRVPPHNITVEESLLGAMLLSKDAIADAIEIVETADFYKPAHQQRVRGHHLALQRR